MRRVMEAAYAKVNLTLAVTGRRADGYHTIESLFQSVSLCDKLTLEQRERGFWLNETAGIPAEENIITRADRLLRREFPNLGGVAVTLEKNIPTQAGLGGGSTDAAASLSFSSSTCFWYKTSLLFRNITFILSKSARAEQGQRDK